MLELQQDLPGTYHAAAFLASHVERLASGTRPHVAVMPNSANASLAGMATLEDRVTVPGGSLLWAISAISGAAAGFAIQLSDLATKKTLWSQAAFWANASGQGSVSVPDSSGALQTIATPLHVLPKPLLILPPGLIGVQITNLAAVPNTLQLCLHFICPDSDASPRPTPQNLEIAQMITLAQRAVRQTAVERTGIAVMNHVPFSVMAAGDNIIVAGSAGARITIYELDIYNVAVQTIILRDGPDRLRGPLTAFPAGAGRSWEDTGRPHFQLTAGRPFILNLSAATEVSGYVRYRME